MKYRTIVIDPPWKYAEGFGEGGTNHLIQGAYRPKPDRKITRRPLPYPSLSTDDIARLPVPALADDDCRLFLWATNRYLSHALLIAAGWGFEYKQLLVWDKRPNVNPLSGSVAPTSAEFLIVAVQGRPERLALWDSAIVQSRKPRSEHSRKPDVFLDLVEHVSSGPYLEMFARRQRLGWDTWGDEALQHVEVSA